MRAALESLLRARKLDVTLTTAAPWSEVPVDRLAATGCSQLDAALGGGLRRGHLSEVAGSWSSGRSTVAAQVLRAATGRGEAVAVIDACDTFDPASADGYGVDLARVLWVRESGDAGRALKAFSLVLQAGGFGLVILDLADVPAAAIRQFPWTTWMRIARLVEGSDTAALLIGSERIARSPGGVTIALESSPAQWSGRGSRARLFRGVAPTPRVVSAR
jgi:recombination protein RecA